MNMFALFCMLYFPEVLIQAPSNIRVPGYKETDMLTETLPHRLLKGRGILVSFLHTGVSWSVS